MSTTLALHTVSRSLAGPALSQEALSVKSMLITYNAKLSRSSSRRLDHDHSIRALLLGSTSDPLHSAQSVRKQVILFFYNGI